MPQGFRKMVLVQMASTKEDDFTTINIILIIPMILMMIMVMVMVTMTMMMMMIMIMIMITTIDNNYDNDKTMIMMIIAMIMVVTNLFQTKFPQTQTHQLMPCNISIGWLKLPVLVA